VIAEISSIKAELQEMADGVHAIRDEQSYFVARESTHHGSKSLILIV
jgi:hypothetical protein